MWNTCHVLTGISGPLKPQCKRLSRFKIEAVNLLRLNQRETVVAKSSILQGKYSVATATV